MQTEDLHRAIGAMEERGTAIEVKPAQTAISKPPDAQRQLSLIKTLTGLAEARQASVSEETLRLYSAHLAEFHPEDVRAVFKMVATRKRGEGETAFPSLGDLHDALRGLRNRRRERESTERERAERIGRFWSEILPHRMAAYGWTEEQTLDRFPEFRGTKLRN